MKRCDYKNQSKKWDKEKEREKENVSKDYLSRNVQKTKRNEKKDTRNKKSLQTFKTRDKRMQL